MTKLQPAYLIVGDDTYLCHKQLDTLLSEVPEHARDEFGPQDDLGIVLQSIQTPSMFADERVIILKEVEQLNAESLRRLIAYLEEPAPASALIMLASKSVPKLAAAVRKTGRVIEANKGKRNDLMGWLRDEAKLRALKIGTDAVSRLVDTLGEDRGALAQALDQLKLAGLKTVSQADIAKHFTGGVQAKLFGFVDAVASKQKGPALEALNRLIKQGEAPQLAFWTLARHFRMLLQAWGGSVGQVSTDLGLPDWRAEKLVRQARLFSEQGLIEAYQLLCAADHKMKKSEEPEVFTLERTVALIASS
ncbi:MAG: DNA polymerase III subunit delta [Actinomycetota bacterium]